ncbi:hypothetical protein PM082_018547 [Marasmius tenuissimus]|nr:hypothetical protein PM082_018547 [Marasmius tenuissimus]
MKTINLSVLGFVPLVAQAAVITLVNFGETNSPSTSTVTESFTVPIGTNSAETTYLANTVLTTTVGTIVNGTAATTIQTALTSYNFVASAPGYKMSGRRVQGADGTEQDMDTECRYTGKEVGKCGVAIATGTKVMNTTVTGPPAAIAVFPVSEAGEAAPPGGSGNDLSSGIQNGSNDAAGLPIGKLLVASCLVLLFSPSGNGGGYP